MASEDRSMRGLMDAKDITNRFTYHPPRTEARRVAHEWVRDQFEELAHLINAKVPDGREKSLAITKLEEAMFWSNAGIARQPADPED